MFYLYKKIKFQTVDGQKSLLHHSHNCEANLAIQQFPVIWSHFMLEPPI